MQRPANEQELIDLKQYIETASGRVGRVGRVADLVKRTGAIHDFCDRARSRAFRVPEDDFQSFLGLMQWPRRFAEEAEESMHELENERERMTVRLEKSREGFDKQIIELEKRIHAF